MNQLIPLFVILQLATGILLSPEGHTNDSIKSNGKASFYHDKFQGRETSNGEQYDKNDFTAAHRTLPFNTIVHVLNKKNGKSVIVRINDRGPFQRSRIIDLSRSAAEKIDMVPYGIVPVTIRQLTLLDKLALSDSSFVQDDIWDCYGNKIKIKSYSIIIWITENWKHAFYTASKLILDHKLENIAVRISGPLENRTYDIMMGSIDNEFTCDSMVQVLKQEGFKRAHRLQN